MTCPYCQNELRITGADTVVETDGSGNTNVYTAQTLACQNTKCHSCYSTEVRHLLFSGVPTPTAAQSNPEINLPATPQNESGPVTNFESQNNMPTGELNQSTAAGIEATNVSTGTGEATLSQNLCNGENENKEYESASENCTISTEVKAYGDN